MNCGRLASNHPIRFDGWTYKAAHTGGLVMSGAGFTDE